LGREAVDLAALAGLELDPWQAWILEEACSVRPTETYWNPFTGRNEPKWACFEAGVMVSRQNGKGDQALWTPILTVDGWSNMGMLEAGQFVYGSDGRPTRVVATSEVYRDSECFEVWFADGSSHVVGGDHLWEVRAAQSALFRPVKTSVMAEGVATKRWMVRCDVQVQTPEADLPIDPYVLGFWLGDGSSEDSCLTVGEVDREWVTERLASAGVDVVRLRRKEDSGAVELHFRLRGSVHGDGFESRARRLGVWGSRMKNIPELYLGASPVQRMELLAGLMDSDGYMNVRDDRVTPGTLPALEVEYCSSLDALADGFMRLARSLGIRTNKRVSHTMFNGERKRDRARFYWTPLFNPFQLPRKADKWFPLESVRARQMRVTAVRRVPTVPTRCIQVAAEDGVYLCGRFFTPTHNSLLEARELAGLFLFGERLIIHSAHQFDTSKEAFERILTLIEDTPDLSREVSRVSRSHGEEGVELRSGQRLRFRTRTKGGGRGFTADCLILDEAMYLGAQQVGALMPTLSARPNAQIWYTGSAGDKDSTQFGRVRARGLKGDDPRLFYAEWSADACNEFCPVECDLHDPDGAVETYARANPGLGIRISVEHVDAERRSMELSTFRQERLGVGDWPVEGTEAWRVISSQAWSACADFSSDIEGQFALAVDTSPDRAFSSLGAAGHNSAGVMHLEVPGGDGGYEHRPGTAWVVDSVLRIWHSQKPLCVVIDKSSQAGSFIIDLEDAGVTVVHPTSREYAQMCGELFSAAMPQRGESIGIAHLGQPPLTSAVASAERRPLADTWAWSRQQSSADISPLTAVTLAAWGFKKMSNEGGAEPWAAWA
jgi:hypothetical protein